MIDQAPCSALHSYAEVFPNMTKRRRAPGEKCPIVKLGAVPLGVGVQYFGRVNFRIRGDRKELNLRMLFWSEIDLCLAQSSCDQRANVHADGICEGTITTLPARLSKSKRAPF